MSHYSVCTNISRLILATLLVNTVHSSGFMVMCPRNRQTTPHSSPLGRVMRCLISLISPYPAVCVQHVVSCYIWAWYFQGLIYHIILYTVTVPHLNSVRVGTRTIRSIFVRKNHTTHCMITRVSVMSTILFHHISMGVCNVIVYN